MKWPKEWTIQGIKGHVNDVSINDPDMAGINGKNRWMDRLLDECIDRLLDRYVAQILSWYPGMQSNATASYHTQWLHGFLIAWERAVFEAFSMKITTLCFQSKV